MLGILNTVQSKGSAFFQFIKEGLVMANRFLTPPSLSHPAQGSAAFDGASDYISLDSDITITSDGTISFWVYWESGTSTIVSQMPYSTNTTYFVVGSSGEIQLLYTGRGSVSDKFSTATGVVSSNEWTHISLSVDNYSPQFYVNGSAVTTTQTGTYASGESIVANTIGMVNNIYWMNGNLANVAIWNRALTSDEINSVMWKQYQDLNTQEINGLQAWYSLDSVEVFDWYGYARNQGAVIEGRTCVDNALNALAQL